MEESGSWSRGQGEDSSSVLWRVQSFPAEESNWSVLGLLFRVPSFPFHPMCQTAWKL